MPWYHRWFRIAWPRPRARLAEGLVLTWNGNVWTGETLFPDWSELQGSPGKTVPGKIRIVAQSRADDTGAIRPSNEQTHAFRFLRDHGRPLRDEIPRAVLEEYPKMRECLIDFCGRQVEERMPDLRSPDEVKRLIRLTTVHISDLANEGVSYVGFEFQCAWEEEHGLGVLTHRDRVIAVGDGETARNARRLWRGALM